MSFAKWGHFVLASVCWALAVCGCWESNRTYSQIPQCTSFIPHNAPFKTEMCTFLFWMVHYGIGALLDLWANYIFLSLALCHTAASVADFEQVLICAVSYVILFVLVNTDLFLLDALSLFLLTNACYAEYILGNMKIYLHFLSFLKTHCGIVTPYGDTDLGQHWVR